MYDDTYIEPVLPQYGVKKRSGRYPWGSGGEPYQHSGDFLSRVESLKKEGHSEKTIADTLGMSTGMLRTQVALAGEERRTIQVSKAKALRDSGMSLSKVAEEMGFKNDSSVRTLLNEKSEERMAAAKNAAAFIKERVDEKGIVDVGKGVELELNISATKLDQALYIMQMEGYEIYGGGVKQINGHGKQTNVRYACRPGTEHSEIFDLKNVSSLRDYISHDNGETFDTLKYPASMNSKRLAIRYREKGGIDKDGVIEVRRGAKDLDLGNAHYSQVRILVDGDKYLKGMAVYGDKMPDGVDVVFNTNKPVGTPMAKVLKPIHTEDPNNPFGSAIKKDGQSYYIDDKGKKQLSLINKRADEGDWADWKDKLPSQFLAKQNKSLIKSQLTQATERRQQQYEDIMQMTNPTVKKKMLDDFAKSCDKDAVDLKGAALPGQKYHVILPIKSLKDTEVYAPNYEDGTKLALIRFPHGGPFELPILTVNNKNREGIKTISPNAKDAVGINKNVADRLSGADFDGDAVLTIPIKGKVNIVSKKPLEGLEGFDPQMEYPNKPGMKLMTNTETEMGKVSNLITDMTLKGATEDELARAVRHSMVVIDAEKHKLNYKQSYEDNKIASLKDKYQGRINDNGNYSTGAATLLSRAKSPEVIIKRQGSPKIQEDGSLAWKNVDNIYRTDPKTGKKILRTQNSTKMMEVKDARLLSSGHPKEELYADYANSMKALANQARATLIKTPEIRQNKEAREKYSKEVRDLEKKLFIAESNKPRERMAHTAANAKLKAAIQDNPMLKDDSEMKRKIGQQELERARAMYGAHKDAVRLNDREWLAIQEGAISPTMLKKLMNNVDKDTLMALAMPHKTKATLSSTQRTRISHMISLGYTNAEIAKRFDVPIAVVRDFTSEKGGK